MQLVWKALAAFALTASSAFALTNFTDKHDVFDGMTVTSIRFYGDANHVSGVALDYFDTSHHNKTLHHGSGDFVDSHVFEDGEYIHSYLAVFEGSVVKYLSFGTSSFKNIGAGSYSVGDDLKQVSEPAPENTKLGGFYGQLNGENLASVAPLWVGIKEHKDASTV